MKEKTRIIIIIGVAIFVVIAGFLFSKEFGFFSKTSGLNILSNIAGDSPAIESTNTTFILNDGENVDLPILGGGDAIESLNAFSAELGFEKAADVLVEGTVNTFDDLTYYRLNQQYNGIPVYGRSFVVSANANGEMNSFSGNYLNISLPSTNPSITENEAITYAKIYLHEQFDMTDEDITYETSGLAVYSFGIEPTLVYTVNAVRSSEELTLLILFVDAFTGDIMGIHSNINDYSGQSGIEYGDLPYTEIEGRKYMQDAGRNISYYSFGYQDIYPYLLTLEEDNKSGIDAMGNISATYDFYKNILGRAGSDGKSGPFFVYVNAIDGDEGIQASAIGANAILSSIPDELNFRLSYGGNLFKKYPPNEWTMSLDVMAHEFTHNVTNSIRTLIGSEAQAVNEAMSDIMAQIVERWQKGETDWAIVDRKMYEYPDIKFSTSADEHDNARILGHVGYLIGKEFIGEKGNPKDRVRVLAAFWYKVNLMIPADCTFNTFGRTSLFVAEEMRAEGLFNDEDVQSIKSAFASCDISVQTVVPDVPAVGIDPNDSISGNEENYTPDVDTSIDSNDANVGNVIELGGTPYRWRVLAVEDERMLLITEEIVDLREFNEGELNDTSWEDCSLRIWLNTTFLNSFDANAVNSIVDTEVINYGDANTGADTVDKIFILNRVEVNEYLPNDSDRIAIFSPDDALMQDISKRMANSELSWTTDPASIEADMKSELAENGTWYWWLRSPGSQFDKQFNYTATLVNKNGSIQESGDVANNLWGVRPAMWIKR